jgi:alkylated DNA nucleotide flippase Atl1
MTDSEKVERRIQSGEPFTYGMLCALLGGNDTGRVADKTIQRYRKKGWIQIIGSRGRAPLWQCNPAAVDDASRLPVAS